MEGTERGTVAELGSERLYLPQVGATETSQLDIALTSTDGHRLAQNSVDLLVIPAGARRPAVTQPVAVIMGDNWSEQQAPAASTLDASASPNAVALPAGAGADPARADGATEEDSGTVPLSSMLYRIGYQVTTSITDDTKVAVTNRPTSELLTWVRNGGDLLFLVSGASPFFWAQGRSGAYSGNWITSFSWIRPEVHKRLQVANPLGLAFRDIMPLRTIVGVPVEQTAVQQDILAGMLAGWIQHPAVHTVQFQYGKGRVVMTTFNLERALAINPQHPIATSMIHDLLEHLVSDACRPILTANY